jgi:hypothetical protein
LKTTFKFKLAVGIMINIVLQEMKMPGKNEFPGKNLASF